MSDALKHLRRVQRWRQMVGSGYVHEIIARHLIERRKLEPARSRMPLAGPPAAYESEARQHLGSILFDDGRLLGLERRLP